MPIDQRKPHSMPLLAKRVFRLSFTIALSLAVAYGMQQPLPFLAPLFALMLGAKPSAPPGPKGLIGLVLVVLFTLGVGLLLTPMLVSYPLPTILLIALGVYFSSYITVGQGKALVGMFLTIGVTLITAAGLVGHALATTVIFGLIQGIVVAVICQWVVYPFFPENDTAPEQTLVRSADQSNAYWVALRATFIIMPAYLLTLSNPAMYLPIILKTVNLAQQSSVVKATHAGRELLGSTLMGGLLAVLFWWGLGLLTSLWMFSLLMLLFGLLIASKIYRVFASRYGSEFWLNAGVTMLILLGPAVEDSAKGSDVYAAFMVRMGLFVGVTLYAWLAIVLLEWWRTAWLDRQNRLG